MNRTKYYFNDRQSVRIAAEFLIEEDVKFLYYPDGLWIECYDNVPNNVLEWFDEVCC